MQHHITSLPKSEVEILVTLSGEEFEPHMKRAAVLLSEEKDIEGFRRGKAPYEVVQSSFGEQAIAERAAELAVRKTYPEILERLAAEGKLREGSPPVGKPDIAVTKLAPGSEFVYKVRCAVLPQVVLPDYRAIAKKINAGGKTMEVSDEEVKKTLDWLRESRAKLVTVDRSAAKGDAVEVDFTAYQDGVPVEQGASQNHPLTIGKGKSLPGFEDELVGMKAGDHKEFTLRVPEGWHGKPFAGKVLDFRVTMKLIQAREVAELDDAFAKSMGSFASREELEKSVRAGLLQEKEEKERDRVRASLIEHIAKDIAAEVPDVLMKSELEKMLGELRAGVAEMGMAWEDYLRHIKKSSDDLRKEWREQAEKRVKIALCLREIARQEHIEPAEEEVKERVSGFLAQFKTSEEAGKAVDPGELLEYIKGVVRNEKVFEFLEGISAR